MKKITEPEIRVVKIEKKAEIIATSGDTFTSYPVTSAGLNYGSNTWHK